MKAWHGLALPLLFAGCAFLFIQGCGGPARTYRPRPATATAPSGTYKSYVVNGATYYPLPSSNGFQQSGFASWYGKKFHGRHTANGEIYDMHVLTAAHKTLPMNTMVLVKNLENGREAVVRINDRGPFVRGRIIDLSYRAAHDLGMADMGVARVRIAAMGEVAGLNRGSSGHFVRTYDFTRGNFYVQVASFAQSANASRFLQTLRQKGLSADIVRVAPNGRFFFRVQVAAGTRLQEAELLEARLRQSGYPDAFVVAR